MGGASNMIAFRKIFAATCGVVLATAATVPSAHAELILSPEDPSAVLGLVAAAAAASPYIYSRARTFLTRKPRKD